MDCVICGDEAIPSQQMCARHWRIVRQRPEEHRARRLAMQRSWDKKRRRFICEYTGIELNDTDPHDPFYISFDHRTPGRKGDLKLTFRALNEVKSSFSWDELVKVVLELDAHFDGKPFDRDVVGYLYWRPEKPTLRALRAIRGRALPLKAKSDKPCIVCKRPKETTYYCARCRNLVERVADRLVKRKALQDGWCEALGRFICYYTGIELEETDWKSPHYLSFDHLTPGAREPQKACTQWVNRMKTVLSEDEFRAFIRELARFLGGEGPFRKRKLRFRHWFMAPKPGPTG